MVITPDELDRLSDDTYKDRRITGSIYCGRCGYNLKTLPYVYVCPECGNHYNARPLSMRGIFSPYEVSLPIRDVAAALVCLGGAVTLAVVAFQTAVPAQVTSFAVPYGMAVILGLFGMHFAWRALSQSGRYLQAREIARRIAAQETEQA
jgi:hypothetical protein